MVGLGNFCLTMWTNLGIGIEIIDLLDVMCLR